MPAGMPYFPFHPDFSLASTYHFLKGQKRKHYEDPTCWAAPLKSLVLLIILEYGVEKWVSSGPQIRPLGHLRKEHLFWTNLSSLFWLAMTKFLIQGEIAAEEKILLYCLKPDVTTFI